MKALKSALVALFVFSLAAPAAAQDILNEDWLDKGFAFGIGADSNITGEPGLSLRMFPIEQFGIELIFGGSSMSRSVEGVPTADNPIPPPKTRVGQSTIAFSLIPEFRFLTSNRAALSGYAGVGVQMNRARADFPVPGNALAVQKATGSFTDIHIEFGLRGEVFLYKYFSIFGRVGVRIDPYSDGEADAVGADGTINIDPPGTVTPDDPTNYGGSDISIFAGNAGLLGQFGFTVWFN